MRAGRRVGESESLDAIRARTARSLAQLPDSLRVLEDAIPYPVAIAPSLRALASELDRRSMETPP
jgi:hypothetical protein